MNEKIRFDNKVREISPDAQRVHRLLDTFSGLARIGPLNAYYGAFDQLKNQYRSLYVALPAALRARIRDERLKKRAQGQLLFTQFLNFFKEDNNDLLLLRDAAPGLRSELTEAQRSTLQRFNSTFRTLEQACHELEHAVPSSSELSPKNVIYLHNQRGRAKRRRNQFIARYKVSPDDDPRGRLLSVRATLNGAFHDLRRYLLAAKARVVDAKGDYLFISTPRSLDQLLHGPVIPIRTIPTFEIKQTSISSRAAESPTLFGEWQETDAAPLPFEDRDAEDLLEHPNQ